RPALRLQTGAIPRSHQPSARGESYARRDAPHEEISFVELPRAESGVAHLHRALMPPQCRPFGRALQSESRPEPADRPENVRQTLDRRARIPFRTRPRSQDRTRSVFARKQMAADGADQESD